MGLSFLENESWRGGAVQARSSRIYVKPRNKAEWRVAVVVDVAIVMIGAESKYTVQVEKGPDWWKR